MSLTHLLEYARNKTNFQTYIDYLDFCARYLEFIGNRNNYQAEIISQNERQYRFYQYLDDGNYNITRPINSDLMYQSDSFAVARPLFAEVFNSLRHGKQLGEEYRQVITKVIYTVQQSIGAALDALPAGKSNQARKVNGDLFERFIQILIRELGIDCTAGVIPVPIRDKIGNIVHQMVYQHDLMIRSENQLKVIGSVKTSSKDRIDKIFMDKFFYSKITETALPHIAIFLNDVQRKKSKREENNYGVNATFLSGHFKAYTIVLNPLDGVYYCDIRPNMVNDPFLSRHIKTIDHFFYNDIWRLLTVEGQDLDEVVIAEEEEEDAY